ncbi:MAG TPA: GNAT family N-acetyltransferase [Alphaproteobacteria bacterium]|nr:GNAT family N-acetyltransferase [Alphaproteobacteria bacterium]
MNRSPEFHLREATAADAELLSRLIISAFSTYEVRLDPPSSSLKETPDAIRAKFATHGGAIAESEGKAVGCVLFTPEEDSVLYVGRLAVDPMWRRRGVARALIAYAELEARRRGRDTLRIQVRIPLVSNQQLFKSCGFVEVSRETHPGYTAPTTIRMEKRL